MNNNQTNTASASASKKALTFEEDFKARAEKNLREKYELLTPPNPAKAMQSMLTPSENSKSLIQVPASSSSTAKSGKTIRNNIQGVLSKRLGPLNTKHLFDGIDDKSIENSIPTAQNVIKSNVSKGLLPKDYQNRFPNLLDGLSLSYAAAEKGNSKAATKAREAAYTETGVTSLAKKNNPLSSQNALPKPDTHFEDLFKAGKLPSLFSGFSNNSNQQKTSEKRYVGVQSGNLNLRSSPGASNTILDKMPRGTAVDFTGRKTTVDGNQWAEVVHNGNKGWVAADFLKTASPESLTTSQQFHDNKKPSSPSRKPTDLKLNPYDTKQIQEGFKEFSDFDNSGSLQCPDFVKWYIDKYTILDWQRGDGNKQVENTAINNRLSNASIIKDPDKVTFPALYSVEGNVKELGASGTASEGHTGIVIGRAKTITGEDAFLVLHTWNGCSKNGYNSSIGIYKIPKSNVTYLNLLPYLK